MRWFGVCWTLGLLDSRWQVGFNICYPAEVAQVVEHGTENAGVDSSSLSLGTTQFAAKATGQRAEVAQW